MSELIFHMVELHDRPQGEALNEFLLALASETFALKDDDTARLKEKLRNRAPPLNSQYPALLLMGIEARA